MSKERARRREERERHAAEAAAQRELEEAARRRREARKQSLVGWVPRPRWKPGIVAARHRRELATTVAILVVLNLVVWLVDPHWSTRIGALVVSLVVAPVVHVMVAKR